MEEIGLGQRKMLTVRNVRIPREVERLTFSVSGAERDLTLENNQAMVRLTSPA